MTDRSLSTCTTATYALWSLVAIGLGATTLSLWENHDRLAAGLGLATCIITALAVVATVRYFTLRVCGLIRIVHGLEGARAIDAHAR